MKCTTRSASGWMVSAIVSALGCCFSASPILVNAQGTQGQNAVYNASGTCNQCAGSSAFIDASMFATTPPPPVDFCKVLNWVLAHSYPTTGAVIDARGLNSTNTSMTCAASPWAGITNPPPSTILLPTGTIAIPSTWVLPNNTHLIGEGDGTSGTTIQVVNHTSLATMIQFGSSGCPAVNSVPVCSGISVERLTLDGQAQAVDGIINQYSQDNTYVDHVRIYQILGTGLLVSSSGTSSATNSGPYSNITFDTGGYAGVPSTVCAQIIGPTSTHGIRGLTCISETSDAQAAVLLDSSNNLVKDVRIMGFYDGILVGANASAKSNVLVNIIGDTTVNGSTPVNTVHISNMATDLSIMGLSKSGLSGTYTLQDDLTGAHLSDPTVGIYALGELDSSSVGLSRFTTSPNAATWAVGTSTPIGCAAATRGSLYSCTGGSSCRGGFAFWTCADSSGTLGWVGVK